MSNEKRLGTDPLSFLNKEAATDDAFTENDAPLLSDVECPSPGEMGENGLFKSHAWSPLAVLENTAMPCVVTNEAGAILFANPALCNLIGHPLERVLRMTTAQLFTQKPDAGFGTMTRTVVHADGGRLEVELAAGSCRLPGGTAMDFAFILPTPAASAQPAAAAGPAEGRFVETALAERDLGWRVLESKGVDKLRLSGEVFAPMIRGLGTAFEQDLVSGEDLAAFLCAATANLLPIFKVRDHDFTLTASGSGAMSRETAFLLASSAFDVLYLGLSKRGKKLKDSRLAITVRQGPEGSSVTLTEGDEGLLKKARIDSKDKNPLTYIAERLAAAGGTLALVRAGEGGACMTLNA